MKHQTWPIFGLGILVAVLIVRLGDNGQRVENLIQSLEKNHRGEWFRTFK